MMTRVDPQHYLEPGDRVVMTPEAIRRGLGGRITTGTVTTVFYLNRNYVGVTRDGMKREGNWHASFWRKITEGATNGR